MIVSIGLNLSPKRGAGATAAESNALHRNAHLAKNCERVLQTVGDAFENRPHDVSTFVRGGEAYQCATSAAVEMGRAFAHEIRSPKQAVTSSGRRCGFGGQLF